MSNTELCERFLSALVSGDFDTARTMITTDFDMHQNGGGSQTFDQTAAMVRTITAAVTGFHYENVVRVATDNGFVEEHDACGALPDGTTFRFAACIVGTVSDGLISTCHEYLDTAAARQLIKALSGA